MGKKIVVVGGVAAGPKAAARVKRLLPDADVTLVDQDSLISYGGCGIPYYVSGDVADENALRSTSYHMLRDADFFARAKGVTVFTGTRATAIDRQAKTARVFDLATKAERDLPYDALVLATGSEPIPLPIAGLDLDGVYAISDLHQAIAIKDRIAKGLVSRAVVIGGGAIGIEMAEAFTDLWGIETALVEFREQLLPGIISASLASMLHKHLADNKVAVYCGEGAQAIIGEQGKVVAVRTAKRELPADLVICAAGVRPRSQLARQCGLEIGARGGIVVNERMQTSDPNIYAAGDCVEIRHLVSGKKFVAPFGSLANKEGRVVADNIAGIPSSFPGSVGAFIMKAFSCCVGGLGLSLETARAEGFDADCSYTAPSDRAHFYPEQKVFCLELTFDRRSRRVLGVHGFGAANDALMARIDAASMAISQGASIDDFANLELPYAPPFATAIDALNAAAHAADNLCDGRMTQITPREFLDWVANGALHPDWLVADIRHPKDAAKAVERFGPGRWQAIPYDQARARYNEFPRDKTLILLCNSGTRTYESQLVLRAQGFEKTLVVGGGSNFLSRMGADWL
ncbi:MAG: FAD-dependent oxidoreductase [Desulfobulbaceae bacterium]|jgi:NADPH-dependent 2,4-dienoyl-CoA reductase/sulfur reductase-like enzyme|nr:FAD-dependent oxidoreductase [Desulfobulbaceae bacterium]